MQPHLDSLFSASRPAMAEVIDAAGFIDALGARWSYTVSFAVLFVAVPLLAWLVVRRVWPALGEPLSRWVLRTRANSTSEDTRRLMAVRNTLGTLAHDVLKHRLLGLVSLVQSLDALEKETAPEVVDRDGAHGERSVATTHPEQWESLRAELLRLCGARNAPNERLWAHWTEAFNEVRRIAGGRIAPPWADASLRRTDRTLRRLRRMVRAFVAGEREAALSPERLRRLDLPAIGDVHGAVLRLSEGCRPVVEPAAVVAEAMSAVGALAGRRDASARVRSVVEADGEYLANAPSRLLVTALERLLDNALRLSPEGAPIGIYVEVGSDEIFGDELLTLRVLDTLETLPNHDQYGTGLQNIHRELAEFECGLAFTQVSPTDPIRARFGADGQRFVKEARVTVPVIAAEVLVPARRSRGPLALSLVGVALLAVFAFGATSRILGGAPVQFAGGGEPVVEFRVDVGEELGFALCEGGRDPQAAVELQQNGCQGRDCTIERAVAALEPCGRGLSHDACPQRFSWTPRFADGSRQGTSYELTVACRAPGPPRSEDVRRIRVVVSRPNSTPTLRSLQPADATSERIVEVAPEREVVVPAGGQFVLSALAVDDDDDLLTFRLEPEHGEVMETIEGRFRLGELDWSADGRWRATISITDDVSQPIEQEINFRAGSLRPLRLESLVLSRVEPVSGDKETLACNSGNNSRLCEVLENTLYSAELGIWFDPLLGHVNERLTVTTDDDSAVAVLPVPRTARPGDALNASPRVGQRWELQERFTSRVLATVRLVEVPPDTAAGLRTYRFEIDVNDLNRSDPPVWTLKIHASEPSNRTEALEATLALARSDQHPTLWASPANMRLNEYAQDSDARRGRASVQVFHTEDPPVEIAEPLLECDNPELESAFEEVRLSPSSERSWQLSVALKPGCIDGLGGSGSQLGGGRCRIELATRDGRDRVSVRVRVEDQACVPTIERLTPVGDGELTEGDKVEFDVELRDPDGDLSPDRVRVAGLGRWEVDLEQAPDALGTALFGRITGYVTCDDLRRPVTLEVRDERAQFTAQKLDIDMKCSPLVSTVDGETRFVVDDGQRLTVPLLADDKVRLEIDGKVGELRNRQFTWTASCDQGRGPFEVEIRGEHRERYGDPLPLTVELRRCRVDLGLEDDGDIVSLQSPFQMEVSRPRRIRIVPRMARAQDLEFEVEPADDDDTRRDVTVSSLDEQGQPDFFYIYCREPGQRQIIVKATPMSPVRGQWLPADPLTLDVECLARGGLEAAPGGEDDTDAPAE